MKNNKKHKIRPIIITMYLKGGLGNQMFQYAFGRTIADKRSRDLFLDTSELEHVHPGITPRHYSLSSFNVRALTGHGAFEIGRLKLLILKKIPWLQKKLSIGLESDQGFQSRFAHDDSIDFFHGYWQSHHYFTSNANQIFQDFTPKKSLSNQALNLLYKINSSNSVMIHVRRGDYISSAVAASYHASLNIDYYKSAYNALCQQVEKPSFFIFSDDIVWCESALSFINHPVEFIAPDLMPADWEDLIVMSHCKHHIIANSSFSWWSAWLADQRHGLDNRFVYAPLKWFVKDSIDPRDRFPYHWKLL